MGQELADNQALLIKSWTDFKREFAVCHELRHPTYDSINLIIVLIHAAWKYIGQLIVEWYVLLFKWFRYVVPSIPYVSSRL